MTTHKPNSAQPAIDPNWVNPVIAQARKAGLEALKPTADQLEHGLALHSRALVIDNYGFSANASPDPAQLQAVCDQNLGAAAYLRQSVESRMTRMARDPFQRQCFEEAWAASGVTCVFRNSGEEGNRITQLIERLAYNTFTTDQLTGFMQRATDAQGVKAAHAQGRRCFLYTTNGVPLSQQSHSIHEELGFIRIFRMLGVRMMHMTYNRRNALGDGCAEVNDGGLSDLGRQAVAEMNRCGVIVDVAHSSHRTGMDAVACSAKPIMISHATCVALNEHCRGKRDELISAVAAGGGVMGIAAIGAFLGGQGDINALLDHVDHVVNLVGVDHVAIGTDVSTPLPPSPGDGDLPALPGGIGRKRLEYFWPEGDALFDSKWRDPAKRLTLAWSNWPLFTTGMVMRGHSDDDILKILGGNALRVLDAVQD